MLFFGFNLLGEFTAWLLYQKFGLTWSQGPLPLLEVPNVFYLAPYIALVLSYFFVRRLGHHMLSQLWLYAVIAGVVGLVTVLASLHSEDTYGWFATIIQTPRLIVVIWFARRVSAISFQHSLLLIGLTTTMLSPSALLPPQLYADPPLAWPLPLYFSLLVGGALLKGLAVWALVNAQTVASSTKTVMPPVMAMVLLAAALSGLVSNAWAPFPVYDWVLPMLVVPALAVVITYTVRVRRPPESQVGLKLRST